MTARTAAAVASLALALTVSACNDVYEVPIETPIQPKMDVSPFQRVLIAGFLAGGTEDVDANLETVRLLRSQLRTKSSLRVIEAVSRFQADGQKRASGDRQGHHEGQAGREPSRAPALPPRVGSRLHAPPLWRAARSPSCRTRNSPCRSCSDTSAKTSCVCRRRVVCRACASLPATV